MALRHAITAATQTSGTTMGLQRQEIVRAWASAPHDDVDQSEPPNGGMLVRIAPHRHLHEQDLAQVLPDSLDVEQPLRHGASAH
eukprot:5932996-Prymnesium_polylepis.1